MFGGERSFYPFRADVDQEPGPYDQTRLDFFGYTVQMKSTRRGDAMRWI